MSSKVLVTGGAGYIGSHIVKLLMSRGYDVIVADNLSTGFREAVLNATLEVGDLADDIFMDALFKKYQFEGVFHFAGSIIVPESVARPIMYYKNNTENSLNLIERCIDNNIKSFVFSSTAAVYGDIGEQNAIETLETQPINPYGQSKLMTEMMLKDTAFSNKDFNYTALRYFNVSGADPDGQIGQAFAGATHLIKVNCEAATGKRKKTYIFGNDFDTPDGTGIRDYIHVSDLAQAHLDAYEFMKLNPQSNVFNCGYGKGFSVKEVVEAVKKVTSTNFDVEVSGRRAGDPSTLVANSDKIRNIIGWKPVHNDLEFIIKTAFEWEASSTLLEWTK